METQNLPMVSPYDLYGTDPLLENNGVWTSIGPMKFLLARAGGENSDFKKMVAKKFAPFQAAIQSEMLPEATAKAMLLDIYAETIVKGWENVAGRDGQPLEYTKDNVRTLLGDLPELFMAIQAEASKLGLYRRQALENSAKN